jgi:hypothetical protein
MSWIEGTRFPVGAVDFEVRQNVYTGSGVHPASCSVGDGNSFDVGKEAEA